MARAVAGAVLIAATLAVVGVGCSSGSRAGGGSRLDRGDPSAICRADTDCGAAQRCVARRCRPACAVDADCGEAVCDLVSGTCAAGRCLDDLDCQLDETCTDGWCLPRPAAPLCQAHTARCDGDDLLVCAPDGTREFRVLCDDPCEEGLGGAHCGESECRDWSTGCLDDRTAFVCDGAGRIANELTCADAEFCYRGRCLAQVCEPRAVWCAGDALVACAPDGRRYDSLPCRESPACADPSVPCVCRDATCRALACEPGSARCVGNGVQRCADDGLGYLPFEDCPVGAACWEGACRAVTCEPGWRQCEGDTLRVCHETGTHVRERYCPAEERLCAGEGMAADCVPRVCRPNATSCSEDGASVVVCDSRGAGTQEIPCLEWGCSAGACLPEPAPEGWVRVGAGEFTMGSPIDELGRQPFEAAHPVTLTRPFFIQATETTQGQWADVLGTRPSFFTDCGDDCPVECVSFWDVLAYANALSVREGREPCYELIGCNGAPGAGCGGEFVCESDFACEDVRFAGLECEGFRLPTEAEWEYVARAGTETAFYSGPITVLGTDPVDPTLATIAWYGANSEGQTHPAGQKTPNDWGLYDTSGNVFEFVWDWFAVDYETLDRRDPIGPPWGANRVARGGSWFTEAERARSAYRHNLAPTMRVNSFGFRLARTAEAPPGP